MLAIGSIGPLGHLPASGTVSVAVVGIPLAWLMRTYLPLWGYVGVWVVFSAASVWVHHVGDQMLGEKDSRKLVLDELVGFWAAVVVMPWTWQTVTAAFFLERIIDIAKVPPANIIEKKVSGGLGVVGDDVVAGVYTMLILLAAEHFGPTAGWLGIG